MPTIITVPDFDAAAREIAFRYKRDQRIVRLEGVCGVGKTHIAHRLALLISGHHIECDRFATKYDDPPRYSECIRRPELDDAIERALKVAMPALSKMDL